MKLKVNIIHKDTRNRKTFITYLVLPIYILVTLLFYIIAGRSMGDIWDKLISWSRRIKS